VGVGSGERQAAVGADAEAVAAEAEQAGGPVVAQLVDEVVAAVEEATRVVAGGLLKGEPAEGVVAVAAGGAVLVDADAEQAPQGVILQDASGLVAGHAPVGVVGEGNEGRIVRMGVGDGGELVGVIRVAVEKSRVIPGAVSEGGDAAQEVVERVVGKSLGGHVPAVSVLRQVAAVGGVPHEARAEVVGKGLVTHENAVVKGATGGELAICPPGLGKGDDGAGAVGKGALHLAADVVVGDVGGEGVTGGRVAGGL